MTVGVGGQAGHQLVALVTSRAAGGVDHAGVGFVHDHQLGTGAEELRAPTLGLDVVGRDHHVG